MFTGLRSIIYPSSDLEADTKFWEEITGVQPYFKEVYYVGFDINGSELGLDPNAAAEGVTVPVTYWKVADVSEASVKILASGATVNTEAKDVGGLLMATFKDKTGNLFGIIEEVKS